MAAKRNRTAVACARCKSGKSKCSDYRPCKRCTKSKNSCRELSLDSVLAAASQSETKQAGIKHLLSEPKADSEATNATDVAKICHESHRRIEQFQMKPEVSFFNEAGIQLSRHQSFGSMTLPIPADSSYHGGSNEVQVESSGDNQVRLSMPDISALWRQKLNSLAPQSMRGLYRPLIQQVPLLPIPMISNYPLFLPFLLTAQPATHAPPAVPPRLGWLQALSASFALPPRAPGSSNSGPF